MRALIFTISVLIAQAVVITELQENGKSQPSFSNLIRDALALDVAPEDELPRAVSASEGLELTSLTLSEAALPESDTDKAVEEAFRGFCAICQADDAHLTHPKTDTCSHKFCEDCFMAYKEINRRTSRTPNGRVLRCPLCKAAYPSDRPDQLVETVPSSEQQRALRRCVEAFVGKHKFKMIAMGVCCIGLGQAIMWSLSPSADQSENILSNITGTH